MDKINKIYNITYELIDNAYLDHPSTFYNKIPFVTIILFILAIVLKTLQKIQNNQNYLQNILLEKNQNKKQNNPIYAFLLNYLNTIGINSFFNTEYNSIWVGLVMLLVGYPLLALIELNIGHALLAYFILALIFYQTFSAPFQDLVCKNSVWGCTNLGDSPYCCGSFIFWATIGCFLAILFAYANNWKIKIVLGLITLLTWTGIILYEYYGTYANEIDKDTRLCKTFYWHGCNFFFGFISGLAFVC
jgi:hypothetical protein